MQIVSNAIRKVPASILMGINVSTKKSLQLFEPIELGKFIQKKSFNDYF
jgi:hypothetical protein